MCASKYNMILSLRGVNKTTVPRYAGDIYNIHMNNLDILRAVAVISVFLHHLAYVSHIKIPFFYGVGGPMLGMHLFFILSGYLITQSTEKYKLSVYCIHRIFRILPAYLFVFIILGLATHAYRIDSVINFPVQFVFNLLLMQQIYPESLLRFDATHVSWSLTVEVLWYLAAPVILLGIKKSPVFTLLGSIILSTVWVILSQSGALDFLCSSLIQDNPSYRLLFLNNSFIGFFCFFVMGGLIHVMRDKIKINNLVLIAMFTVFACLYPAWYTLTPYPIFLTGIGVAALVILALNTPNLELPLLKWVSDISYSIYLIHFIVLDYVFNHWGWLGFYGAVFATALTLLLANYSYRWIEKPFVTIGRKVSLTSAPSQHLRIGQK